MEAFTGQGARIWLSRAAGLSDSRLWYVDAISVLSDDFLDLDWIWEISGWNSFEETRKYYEILYSHSIWVVVIAVGFWTLGILNTDFSVCRKSNVDGFWIVWVQILGTLHPIQSRRFAKSSLEMDLGTHWSAGEDSALRHQHSEVRGGGEHLKFIGILISSYGCKMMFLHPTENMELYGIIG